MMNGASTALGWLFGAWLAAVAAPPTSAAQTLLRADELRAYAAAMGGRKADALAAVQRARDAAAAPVAEGDSGWDLTPQYAALVRFGLWDEMLAALPPDPRRLGLTAGYLYARGVALAARGRLPEAEATLTQLRALAAQAPPGIAAGANTLDAVVEVAAAIVAARIAASAYRSGDAIALLRQAVAADDRLAADQPADWFFPPRDLLGAQLLEAGQAAEAESVYREDLRRQPGSGWALYGLAQALQAQGRSQAAAAVRRQFAQAWKHADVRLVASAFWFAGPDTTSCECQREPLVEAPAGR
jgi:tetratricopeptide (TPR) repeat protein